MVGVCCECKWQTTIQFFLKYKRSNENKKQKQRGVKEEQQRVEGRYCLSQFLTTYKCLHEQRKHFTWLFVLHHISRYIIFQLSKIFDSLFNYN